MKICIVSQTFAPQDEGGAEISSRHAATNLSARHEVVVLSLGMAGVAGAEPGECVTNAAYRLVRLPFHNAYLPGQKAPPLPRWRKALWHIKNAIGAVDPADMRRFLQKERPDLLYAQNSSRMQPALYRVAAELRIPVVQHLRDYALLCPGTSMYYKGKTPEYPPLSSRILTARARKASASVGTVIAVSGFVKQRFVKNGLFPRADWHVLHNTNTARSAFDEALMRERPAPEPGFTFGYLGAISHEKGVKVMLEAFCNLPADLNARLLIAGRGKADFTGEMRVLAEARAPGRVEWLGHVPPEAVLARSEVVLMPSIWHEPLGRVPIEAAIYRLPTIAAQSGGIPEVVEQSRIGWTYEAESILALAALMKKAAEPGAAAWRLSLSAHFPGLANFRGTAEETNFYERLENILTYAVTHNSHAAASVALPLAGARK